MMLLLLCLCVLIDLPDGREFVGTWYARPLVDNRRQGEYTVTVTKTAKSLSVSWQRWHCNDTPFRSQLLDRPSYGWSEYYGEPYVWEFDATGRLTVVVRKTPSWLLTRIDP